MKKWIIGIIALTMLAMALPGAAVAQEPAGCGGTYFVRPGDTLARIAAKSYDNPWAYPAIVYATNQAAFDGDGFQIIADPNLIEPGWKLCLPADERAMGAVDVKTLKNFIYLSDWTTTGTAPLVDGVYSESAAPGSATQTVVKVHDRMVFGYTADRQQLAAVVLVTDPGGSGTFYELAALTFKEGEPQHVASASLGDRVHIQSLALVDGEIVVEIVSHGPDDPLCCPTQQSVVRYTLKGEELVQVSGETADEPGVDLAGIELDTSELDLTWQAVYVPEAPYDQSMPPGPKGLPAHVEILFGGSQERAPGAPVLYIIPVSDYRELWENAGNPSLSVLLDRVYAQVQLLPDPTRISGMPALPVEEIAGRNDLAVQVGRVEPNKESATRDGYRFIGRWAQDANPVTNGSLRYVYQGFTTDGRHLVALFYPVTTNALPAIQEVPQQEFDQMAADYGTYMRQRAEMLNELADADWEPSLTKLDALVASLTMSE